GPCRGALERHPRRDPCPQPARPADPHRGLLEQPRRHGLRVVGRFAALLVLVAQPGLADPPAHPALLLPVACAPGVDRYVQNYFDHVPGPGVRDPRCGGLTYDGHDGTDFALPTDADLARGVAVLAAAPGTIRAVRDGMEDIPQGRPGAPDVTDRE